METSPVPMERMRWFTGRFVTARDLTDEQHYFLGRRRLLNRLLHGHGVLCGLDVRPHPEARCRPETVLLAPGVAFDCLGREVILEDEVCVQWPAGELKPGGKEELAYVAIRYQEAGAAPRYSARDACTSSVERRSTRIREGAEVRLVVPDEPPDCRPGKGGCEHVDCDGTGRCGCLEPDCDCGGWIRLARLDRLPGEPIRISPIVRQVAVAHCPTRICGLSWTHGGTVPVRDIIAANGRLDIGFDRPLRERDGEATGVHRLTYVVEHSEPHHAPAPVPAEQDPYLADDEVTAVFPLARALWAPAARGKQPPIVGQRLVVTLYCDFVLDCHGDPVDGDFLRARLPTGNGTPGGVFRSWFRVTD